MKALFTILGLSCVAATLGSASSSLPRQDITMEERRVEGQITLTIKHDTSRLSSLEALKEAIARSDSLRHPDAGYVADKLCIYFPSLQNTQLLEILNETIAQRQQGWISVRMEDRVKYLSDIAKRNGAFGGLIELSDFSISSVAFEGLLLSEDLKILSVYCFVHFEKNKAEPKTSYLDSRQKYFPWGRLSKVKA